MEVNTTPTPARLKEDVQLIKDWISKQPHLPKIEDEEWLITFLHYNKYSLEKTKYKLDNYFSFRTKYPEILKNRDPAGSEILQARASYKIVYADKLTKNGEQLMIGQMQADTSTYDAKSVAKMMLMLIDTVYLEHQKHSHAVMIVDCRYLSYIHFLKSVPWLKQMHEIFFAAYSDRLKAVHIINAPAHVDTIFNTIKGLLPRKIAVRFYVHSTSEDVCKLVDEDVVCSDFGGIGPTLAEYDEYTTKRLEKHREWFSVQENVCSNEELRGNTDNKKEDMQGSFRKLQVD